MTVAPETREAVEAVARLGNDQAPEGVSNKQLAARLGLDESSASRRARKAKAAGYLVNLEVDVEDLREVIDLWADRSARTRQKVTSVIRSFWAWAEDQGHVAISPAARIKRPKAEKRVRGFLPADARPRLLEACKHPETALRSIACWVWACVERS